MDNSLEIVKQEILLPANLQEQDLSNALGRLMGHSIDSGDLYFQVSHHESWALENGIVKEGFYAIDRGVGVRAISQEKTGFAYSDEIALSALMDASQSARAIARSGQKKSVQVFQQQEVPLLYQSLNPLQSLPDSEKVKLLQWADSEARRLDKRIEQVFVNLSGVYEIVLIAATDGTFVSDVRPLIRFGITVIAEENGRREQASSGGGGRVSYDLFTQQQVGEYVNEAVRLALVNLQAIDAPAGVMPVVLGPGWPGVLLHEAVGHGLEGDFNRKGTSTYANRLGEKVASSQCTVVDDGTIANRRGSLTVDDEGIPSQNTVLIEKGILKGYMMDKMNAGLMGMAPTGNGRRESYAHLVMPRMTNTYMLAGDYEADEIIKSVDKGLYAVNFGGGQVDITNGKFVFSTSEAYLIENGKITKPVKGATLIGNGPDVMTKISMVGNNLKLDTGVGVCGKSGQSVPVGVGQPTLKIDELTIGGTSV